MPSPIIRTMMEKHGWPLLDETTIDEFLGNNEECVLFFTENPERFPESNDVAAILPELLTEYDHRFTAAVIDTASQKPLQQRYGFREWPALVFLRNGLYLGSVCRVQNWVDYIVQINTVLQAAPQHDPGFVIPAVQL